MKLRFAPFLLFIFVMLSFGLPKNIQKKVDKEIKDTFELETFNFISVAIPQEHILNLSSKFTEDNLFKISSKKEHLGYAYVSKAPSKTDNFDYLVLLDKNLVVLKTKVLIYREEYGGEIGSKRWLTQFEGKTQHDQLKFGDNIVAISGATISVRSMTNAMNDLLKSLKILHSKNIL